jgi:hypothetical protein
MKNTVFILTLFGLNAGTVLAMTPAQQQLRQMVINEYDGSGMRVVVFCNSTEPHSCSQIDMDFGKLLSEYPTAVLQTVPVTNDLETAFTISTTPTYVVFKGQTEVCRHSGYLKATPVLKHSPLENFIHSKKCQQ